VLFRSLEQIRSFMSQLDGSKNQILKAIEQVNSLAISLNGQKSTLDLALKELPGAIASVDRQRDDIIKMLSALSNLSDVGTRVIEASEANTVKSLDALAPTLTAFAKSGDDFVNSLQIFLTYPFIDGIVGKNAQQARDLHMGDYTNLSVQLDLDLKKILEQGVGVPGGPPIQIPDCDEIPNPQIGQLCRNAQGQIIRITKEILDQILPSPAPTISVPTGGLSGGKGGGGKGGGLVPGVPGLGRAAVGAPDEAGTSSPGGVDTDLAAMLVWGVMPR